MPSYKAFTTLTLLAAAGIATAASARMAQSSPLHHTACGSPETAYPREPDAERAYFYKRPPGHATQHPDIFIQGEHQDDGSFKYDDGIRVCMVHPFPTNEGKSLGDVLTVDKKGRLWWDYARDVASVNSRLITTGITNTTILVPVDSAIIRLARKPHQNKEGETSDSEAVENTERFLAAHIIPDFSKPTTDKPVKNLLGNDIEIKGDEERGGFYIYPGDIEVVDSSLADNGRIYYINGVLPF